MAFRGSEAKQEEFQKAGGLHEEFRGQETYSVASVWGYATSEQIERLKESISPYERDKIMEQIKKQTKLKGKID